MNIGLAYVTDDEHKVHKTLNSIGGYTGVLKDEMSALTPVVRVQVPEATAVHANYASIVDLEQNRSRYYFIRDHVLYRTGVVDLHLELDPLMTYESEIRALTCTVDRNEVEANAYLIDNEYKILAYDRIVAKEFPNGFEDESMILFAVG